MPYSEIIQRGFYSAFDLARFLKPPWGENIPLFYTKGDGFFISRLSHMFSFLPLWRMILRFFFPSGFLAGKKKTVNQT